jgi:hypothetical protein
VEGDLDEHTSSNEPANFGTGYMKLNTVPLIDSKESISLLQQHHQDVFNEFLPLGDRALLPPTPVTAVQTPQSGPIYNRTKSEHVPPNHSITIDQAEALLSVFHEMKHFFPFVVIPENASIKSMSRKSPFLLLGILFAASSTDIQMNNQLDHEFKRVLGEKVILEGRKSLDFLQGLLVYNAWLVSWDL